MVSSNVHLPHFDQAIVAPATHLVGSGVERQTGRQWRQAAEATDEPEAVNDEATDHSRLAGMRRATPAARTDGEGGRECLKMASAQVRARVRCVVLD